MAIFAIWSPVVWNKSGWSSDGFAGFYGSAAVEGDIPEATTDAYLPYTQGSISPSDTLNMLMSGLVDVYVHEDKGVWSDMIAPYQEFEDLRDAFMYQLPLLQARVAPDGSFSAAAYLNAVETAGTDAADRIVGGLKVDIVDGGAGNDKIKGLGGFDILTGGDGKDRLLGGTGSDLLYGGRGNDRLFGGEGSDELYGHGGRDRLDGGDGFNDLYGGGGRDRLIGHHAGQDYMHGGNGRDVLVGGPGDYLYGERGDDVLIGRGGREETEMTGGAGDDRFVLHMQDLTMCVYWILDFETGADVVDLRHLGLDGFEENVTSFREYGTRTEVVVTTGERVDGAIALTFYDVAKGEITADDFLF